MVIVYGRLPFVVLIEDGFNERGVTIPGKEINVMNHKHNIQACLFFKKERNNNTVPYIHSPPEFEDYNGEITYSHFQFITGKDAGNSGRFFDAVIDSKEEVFDIRAAANLVTEFINKFIYIYRIKTRSVLNKAN